MSIEKIQSQERRHATEMQSLADRHAAEMEVRRGDQRLMARLRAFEAIHRSSFFLSRKDDEGPTADEELTQELELAERVAAWALGEES